MIKLFKQPLFLIGFLFITGLLCTSFIYSEVVDHKGRQIYHIFGENNELIDSSPIAPRVEAPLGTDRLGFDMLSKVLIGAKFTIIAAFVIATLRMVISIPLGLMLGSYFSRIRRYVNSLVDAFHFIPLTIIAIYLLGPVLVQYPGMNTYTLFERMFIEVIVLTLLTVPILTVLIGNETSELFKAEFILSAKTLGGRKPHIIIKHILPILKGRFFILFGQQFVQTLLVMAHLGLFNLYFGGTLMSHSGANEADPPRSITNEWSGLIGGSKEFLQWAPWITFTPIVCFALTILAVTFMVEGYSRVSTGRPVYFKKRREAKKQRNQPVEADFTFLNKSEQL
ncbi:ABC transporter permease [uncultured Metabacillus sp.]|uniref:ABC transporter permease n=1 Tax=uncultured Metabacillus sp. TaxID=2860135 RepID=UPI00263660AC|nr:ABC transporter permease subunit [uncultured Metabacillus sp.]